MSDAREHLRKFVGEGHHPLAVLEVDPHRDHSIDAGGDRLRHHLARVAQLLQMEMRVYEDASGSAS